MVHVFNFIRERPKRKNRKEVQTPQHQNCFFLKKNTEKGVSKSVDNHT